MPPVPQPGDFGLVSTAGPLLDRLAAAVIRFDTDSPVNHAFVYVGNGNIIEAVSRVKIDYVDEYSDITWSTGRLPAALTPTSAQRDRIIAAANDLVGDRYNILDILAIGLAQRRTGRLVNDQSWWAKRLSADGREICSQLVDAAYLAAGIHLFDDGRLPGLVSPGDLYSLLQPEM
jgi:cell wall-associated NlpC family hydrolase